MAGGYAEFLASKSQLAGEFGFQPVWLPDCLFDFQRHLVEWAVRRGRAAVFADCGMGKSLINLVVCENVVRHTNGRALILTPPAVAPQFVSEGEKFGVGVTHCRTGRVGGPGVYVTNAERLHLFDRSDFVLLGYDESSGLKDADGERRAAVTEFMRVLPYRGLYTATAAPNDFDELGTSSEALGELGYQDMLSRFFKKVTAKDYLGWGRTSHQLRTYAERDFWRWVCSWARACRRPSDLGFDDGPFVLPELVTREHAVPARTPPPGCLFDAGARSLPDQRAEQRRTLAERCEAAAALTAGHDRSICWVNLNDEGDLITRLIPGARQVSGRTPEEEREEIVAWFTAPAPDRRVLVSKPEVFGFGLNLQRCAHMTFFVSHSFERYYQAVRRCWRFGQTRPVTVDVVTTDGGAGVLANLRRKQAQADAMFARLVELMSDTLRVGRGAYGSTTQEVPSWL